MLGGIHTHLLVAVTLLFLTQTGTQCRAENDMLQVTLPDWKKNSEYVTKCYYDRHNDLICDWTRSHQRTDGVPVNILESGALDQGEACLEFWYLAPVAANGSELRALLKNSTGLVEIWTSSALSRSSWRQVFVPLNIIESGTQVVLEAVQAESMEGQVIFNWIGVRRGSCGPQCESNTELWTDESTRCLCSAGQLYCSPSQCPEGQICGPQRESSSGISTTGMCTIHSGTDCSTFDGVLFRFMGPCTYVLAKTCSPTETLPMFRVEVVNEHNGNSSLPTVQQVIVEMANFRVSLLKRQTHRVVVNGIWRKLPLSLSSGTVNIKSNKAAVLLRTGFGLSVSYDNAGAVHITLPSAYSDKVCGLCGNFNNLRGDDFRKPNGTDAHDATDLAKSWHTEETTSFCETILLPHQCDPLEKAEYASELYCGGLLSSTGPFTACLSALGAESYFRACVAGMCSSHGDPGVLCDTLQVYAGICQEAGIAVQIWRNSTFCPLQCGENSHFNSCTEGCPDVCSSLDFTGSCVDCEERCECDFGFKLSGGKCVPAEDCGCWFNGTHYEKGETFLEGECMQQCQCKGSDNVQCTPMQCPDNEVCKVKDGVKGCFPFKPVTCNIYGDPHFVTFDGLAYDFQGGCIYTLTTTCGYESSVQFTVTGHNMHPALQNFTQSKLEAVALQVEDLYLTLNQSGEVYVDSSPVQLPYSNNASYGSLWVYMRNSYIILETTFGLRMMIDRQHRLFLQVDERYMYELCGLCGTYSKLQDDDFVKPGGQNTTDPFEFADSWRVPDNNECIAYPNDPRLCDYDEENEAYNECYTLLGEAFGPCHEPIHPSIYLNSCVYDYCATSGDQHTLCESLTSYAAACQVAGVELGNWQTNTACAEPPTTATLPTTPTPSSPTSNQTFCPMNCDFEKNLCGWEQLVQDSFEWTRHSGPTPSDLSGPNQDHTTGEGFYIYIEGNSITHGDSARLLSSWCHYNGPLCLHFWYHMYGSATAMTLNMYLLKDNKATKLWSMLNDQGPEWHQGNVDIRDSGPFQIIIEGIRGSNHLSDVAIDDISIHFGSCSGGFPGMVSGTKIPPTTAALPSLSVCNLNCSFDSNLCSWDQMITDAFDWTWQGGSTPTLMTGPSADHTGDGHYLYIEASSVTHGDTARLTSSECSESGHQCLQFWYHMYGSADTMGLHVYLLQDRTADAIWWKRNNQGNMWHLAQVDFTTIGSFQIIIEGRRGSNEESDVAIDDVQLYHGQCSDLQAVITPKPEGNTTAPPSFSVPTTAAPEPPVVNVTAQPLLANITITPIVEATTNLIDEDNVTETPDNRTHPVCELHCNFEQDLCQWSQLLTDVFDWTRHLGSTPTMMTGPSSDHTTGGGHYIYIEANSVSHGDTARLISSECLDSGPQCLQFWYHMYGSADTMGLHVYLLQDRKADAVWWKRNNQGNMWHLAQVDLTTTESFQIIFEGRKGSNDQSDVAIDDVSLHRGPCTDGPKPTAAISSTTQPLTSTTPKPQPPSTATFTTTSTTAAVTDSDTQPPAKPSASTEHPNTSNPDVPTPTRPQQPTSRPLTMTTTGSQTTFRTPSPTTEQPVVEPEFETTEGSQNTARPEQLTRPTEEAETSSRCQPTRESDEPTVGSQLQTTATSGTPNETQPKPQTTARPQLPTITQPQPSTTVKPQPPTETQPQPETAATPQPTRTTKPHSPTNASQPTTTVTSHNTTRPQPTTTRPPTTTTTSTPQPTRTTKPHSPTNASQPTTTVTSHNTTRPQPTTTRPPTTTATPQPTRTTKPHSPTNASQSTTTVTSHNTTRPQLTTTRPPTTTATPQPTRTTKPHSPTNASQPTTTVTSHNTTRPQPGTTRPPPPPTTTTTTATPQPTRTTKPHSPTIASQPTTTVTSHNTTRPQPTTTRPPTTTTDTPQPTTIKPHPPTNRPQPTTTTQPTTTRLQPTTAGPQPPMTAKPQPTTTTNKPQSTTTVIPQPTTTARPQPLTTPVPTPSCPENSHYTMCIYPCSPTCTHLHGQPHCNGNETCVQGCECDDGYVLKERICVPIQQCGCVDRDGSKYHFNEEWYTNHCSQKCECEKHKGMGKIDCDDKDECDGNAVCLRNEEGHYYCQSTGFDECTIKGDPEYRTFDNLKHDFDGEHSYVLVRTNNLPNNFPDVYIEGINAQIVDDEDDSQEHDNHSSDEDHSSSVMDDEDDDDDNDDEHDHDSEEHEEHHTLQELKIKVYNYTVEFKKNRRLVLDGRRTKTPVSPTAGLNIQEHSSRIYLKTDFGLSVEFDGHSRAEIILPRIYRRKVGGLCGNFDGRRRNDWMKPDGTMAGTVQEFGESWRV